MLGKRQRTSQDDEQGKLMAVFNQIKAKYEDAQSQTKEETKDGLVDVFTKWSGQVISLCVRETVNPLETQKQLLQAMKDVYITSQQQGDVQPQEIRNEQKLLKLDLLDCLTEIVQSFQIKLVTFENDLQNKVDESSKLISELEEHFLNN